MKKIIIMTIAMFILSQNVWAVEFGDFAKNIKNKYGVPENYTIRVINKAVYIGDVIKKMDHAAEKLPWYKYKPIFLNKKKISKSKIFYKRNKKLLKRIEKKYKVPSKLIVAIIGIESDFGRYNHRYRVLDSLYTLGFYYPRRSVFFKKELAAFIAWTYRSNIDPYGVMGSYAGAVGMPQFMPTSILKYGVDFNKDGKIDLVNSYSDSMASIGNYIKKNGWKYGKPTAIKTKYIKSKVFKKVENKTYSVSQLRRRGVRLSKTTFRNYKTKIERFELSKGYETWALFHNFKVVMKYNPNKKYSLAVFLLSRNI